MGTIRASLGCGAAAAAALLAASPATALQCLGAVPLSAAGSAGAPRETGMVYTISDLADGIRLVGGDKGLFRYADGKLFLVAGDGQIGVVNEITPRFDGVRLIGTTGGLFRMEGTGLSPVPTAGSAPASLIERIVPAGGGSWLVAGRGVFLYSGGVLRPVPGGGEPEVGQVRRVTDMAAGMRLIGGTKGLFRYSLGRITPVSGTTGAVEWISHDGGDAWLVGAGEGMFRFAGGVLTPVPVSGSRVLGSVQKISRPYRGMRLVSANGLFVYANGRLTAVGSGGEQDEGAVQAISDPVEGEWLVSTAAGILRFDGRSLSPVPGGLRRAEMGYAYSISSLTERSLLLAAQNGVYLYAGGRLALVPGPRTADGDIYDITEPLRGERLLATANFFARYIELPTLRAEPNRGNPTSRDGSRPIALRWTLSGDCAEHAGRDSFLLKIGDAPPAAADFSYDPTGRTLTLTLPKRAIPQAETLRLYLKRTGVPPVAVSKEVRLRPALDWAALGALLAKWGAVLHTLFFLGLIVAARWSERAAAMLLHPLSRSSGLWFGFALQFSATLQQWLLRRWFEARKRDVRQNLLHPLPVRGLDNGEAFESPELVGKLHPTCRIWLEAKPGMGKTQLLRELEARFFREHRTLPEAIRAFGCIPLFVPLRDLRGADLGKGDRLWPARVAEAVLGGQGFIPDETSGKNLQFVEAFLKRSRFVLLLDGANEVPWDQEIISASRATAQPGLVVTSQATPAQVAGVFERYALPETMTGAVEPLLKLFLGAEQGGAVYARVAGSPLIGDIRSGYDVRLLEALHRTGAADFPRTRLGLYEAILGHVFASDGSDDGLQRLYGFAWSLWRRGERQFAAEDLDAQVQAALMNSDMPIVRSLDGSMLEFRHDQMRGYLAARYVLTVVNPLALLNESEPGWPQARSEQDLVWHFLSEMADSLLARRIYDWTLEKPDDRIALQAAMRQRLG